MLLAYHILRLPMYWKKNWWVNFYKLRLVNKWLSQLAWPFLYVFYEA